MVRIVVIGAGINGLASAVKIKQKYPSLDVTVVAERFTPETTGDGSGGLWYPYLCGRTPGELLKKWGIETYNYLHELWVKGTHSISLMPFISITREAKQFIMPSWADEVFGFHEMNETELKTMNKIYSGSYVQGHTFMTFIVPPQVLIRYLLECFQSTGGKTLNFKITNLQDKILEQYDVVINCTGLGARELVPDDKVFPIRGQIIKVKANWITATVIDEDEGNYIIPNYETCVLGGTHQENDYSTQPNDEDTKFILEGCQRLVPGLRNAEILEKWAGLRPGRHEVRLEKEYREGKLYIHNYGHGGSGLTLFWGCASQVLEIFENEKLLNKTLISKL